MALLRFIRRHPVGITFLLLALVAMGPLLKPGYILTLDSPISLNQDPLSHLTGLSSVATSVFGATDNSAPYSLVLGYLDSFLPGWVGQKAFLILILFLAGWGVTRLPLLKGVGRYYAGAFYLFNPFVYIRFVAGQWGFLLGYALMPFALKAFIDLLEQPTPRRSVILALMVTLVALAQLHSLALLVLLFLGVLVAKAVQERASMGFRRLLPFAGVAVALVLALNLFWAVPSLVDVARGETVVGQFSEVDRDLYKPVAVSSLGTVFDVASLQGFWRGNYQYAGDYFSLWWLGFILTLFLTFVGAMAYMGRGRRHWLPLAMLGLGGLAFVLALGAATGPTKAVFEGLWAAVPGFSAFRDSHKFLALLALAYAYLGALGVQELWRLYAEPRRGDPFHWRRVSVIGSVLLPLAFAFPLVGAAGQLGTTDFPDEWYQVRETLERDKGDYQVLFLPWHMYSGFGWLPNDDRILATPAHQFFGSQVISADNIEYGVFSQSVNPVSRYVETILSHSQEVDNFGELLAPLNVRYVILVQEADFPNYEFLGRQQDMEVAQEEPGITLFRNTYTEGRAYAVDGVRLLSSLDQIVELSREEDLMANVYLLEGDGAGIAEVSGSGPDFPEVKRVSMVRYEIGPRDVPYTILVTRHGATNDLWRLDGKAPDMMNLGMMPVYRSDGSPATAYFSRWTWVLALNSLALLGALASVVYLLWPWAKGYLRRRMEALFRPGNVDCV